MADLYFKVNADWEKVVKLRDEISKLETQLKNFRSSMPEHELRVTETRLAETKQEFTQLATEAARAGAQINDGFKKKIYDASQVVNDFSEKILQQKNVVKEVEADVKRLGEAYRASLKKNPLASSSKLAEYTAAKKALDEEKAALFGLTQQQAEARLSVKKLRDEYAFFKNESKETKESIDNLSVGMSGWVKGVLGALGVKSLISNMVKVRSEFQAADVAIQTLLGNKERADKLMSQVREYAKISPLEFSDVTQATQMMLGFNIEAEKVPRFISAIGDVSMGEKARFNSLTLAFSQMSATGKLMGQDLNQMINAGFNPLQVISEKTGKSMSVLKDEMSKGAISAEMVQQAFIDTTSAGGKFFNMSENASKTISGQLSMMSDAMDAAFNEVGQKTEGFIVSGIEMTTKLIDNYETIGRIIAGLVTTYGAYRTAVMLTTIAMSKHTVAEVALTNARIIARRAQMALNAAMLTNPYVLLTTVVFGLGTAMYALSGKTSAATRAQKEYNEIKDKATQKEKEHKEEIEKLLEASRDESLATLTRQKSLEDLRKEYPKIFEKYDLEKLKLEDVLKLKKEINEEDSKRSVQGRKDDYDSLKRTVANQQRFLQLFDNPSLRQNMSDSDKGIWKMFAGKQSYVQVREQMEKDSGLLKKFQKDVLEDNISAYKANLEKYSKEKLEAELKIAQSSASKRNGFDINGMMVTGGDLEDVISSISKTLDKKKNATTYKQDFDKAKKEWDEAKKKLESIEKDKSKFTSKQYEGAKKKKEAAEKKYKDLGGVAGSALTKQESQTEKLRKQNDKYKILLDKQALERRRSAEDMQMQIEEARIKAMDEGSQKVIAELELNYEKELQAIDRQKEDYLRKKVDDARSAWEADPNNKGKSFDGGGIVLSDAEKRRFDNLYKAQTDSYLKAVKEQQEKEKDSWNAYLKEFGDYQQKKQAIAEEYTKKIAEASTEGEKATLKERQKKELEDLDEQYGKTTMAMADLFEDASKKSVRAIQDVIDKYETLVRFMSGTSNPDGSNVSTDDLKGFGFTVKDLENVKQGKISIKDITDALDALRGRLADKSPWQKFSKNMADAFSKFKKSKDSSLDFADGISDIGSAITELLPAVNQFGSDVANIFGKDDSKITGIFDAVDGLGQTASGVGQIMSGDIVGGAMAAVHGISQVVSALDGLFGADYSQYNKMVEEYGVLNDVWDTIISKKQKYIDISYGDEARKVGQEAAELLGKKIQSNRELGIELLNAGTSAGSHSIGVRQRKNISQKGWQELAKAASSIGFNYDSVAGGRMEGLFDLTAEQLSKLQDEAPTFWAKLDDGVREYLQNIIDCNDELEEMKDKLNETMTGVSFDSFYDSFISTLSDMSKSSKDMADDFGEYLKNAILSNLIANKYKERIKGLYDEWASKSDSNGDGVFDLTSEESAELKKAQKELADEMIRERDEMAKVFGWESTQTQSASAKGFSTMSQDTADELNGRFTAVYESNIRIESSIVDLKGSVMELASANISQKDIADETRTILAQSFLELQQIRENTGEIIAPIKNMSSKMDRISKKIDSL